MATLKTKKTSSTGGMDKYAKDNEKQTALKSSQKHGMPHEGRAYKSGAEPMDYAKKKPTTAKKAGTASKSTSPKPSAPKRSENKPIEGVAHTQGMLTRTLPSDQIKKDKSVASKGVTDSRKKYGEKDAKIASVMAKGKKKNGTMKASAQRKTSKIKKGK